MAYFADRFRDALKDGGRALLLGFKDEQLPAPYRTHPRLIWWDSDSPEMVGGKFRELPVRTRVVVCSRWLGHHAFNKAQDLSRRGQIVFMGKLTGTGELARMLREAIPMDTAVATPVADSLDIHTPVETAPPEPPSQPVPELFPTPEPNTQFSTVTACVRFYAQREIERQLPDGRKRTHIPLTYFEGVAVRCRAHGWETDADKVQGIFSNLRSVHRRRLEHERELETMRTAIANASAAAPAPLPVMPEAPKEPLPADLAKLVQMADELEIKSIVALELADELRKVVREHQDLRVVKEKYDALMAVMQGNMPAVPTNGSATSLSSH